MRWRWIGLWLAAAVLVAGCGEGRIGPSTGDGGGFDASVRDAGDGGADGDAGADGEAPGLTDGGPLPDGGVSLPRGEGTVSVRVDGLSRDVHLVVPDAWSPGRPCLLGLHGNGGTPSQFLAWSELDRLAREQGIAVAAPRAIAEHADGRDWDTQTRPAEDNMDVQLVLTVGDWLAGAGCDPQRIYLLGYRLGGQLAFHAGLEGSTRFAAMHISSAARPTGAGLVLVAERKIPVQLLIGEADVLFDEALATQMELLSEGWPETDAELDSVPGLEACCPRPLEGRIDDVWSWLSVRRL